MSRREIANQYKVNKHGIICSPGKFEGEMLYVPYFWDMGLSGMADRDDGKVWGFDLTRDDHAEFPELGRKRTVKLYERDDGFVCEL